MNEIKNESTSNSNPLLEIGESGFPVAFEQAMSLLMNEMHKLVEPECAITVFIRTPANSGRDICWTDDDLKQVAIMANRCYQRELDK